jgi:hypothetical protein
MDISFEGLNILINIFCVCADGFQGMSKAFNYLIQLLTFYLLYRITSRKQVALKHFQCRNRCFRVFEAGYWQDFQGYYKGASLNFEFDFFRNKKL